MTFVVVTGLPGAGKSTLAQPLAARLGLPLLAKDTVKEALAVLEDPATVTVERSQRLGGAAFEVIFAIASQSGGAVLEASWNPALARPRLAALPGPVVEVRCSCPPEIARTRYAERAPTRHWVHLDRARVLEDRLWATDGGDGLSDAPVIVDTTGPVDVEAVVAAVRGHLGSSSRPGPGVGPSMG